VNVENLDFYVSFFIICYFIQFVYKSNLSSFNNNKFIFFGSLASFQAFEKESKLSRFKTECFLYENPNLPNNNSFKGIIENEVIPHEIKKNYRKNGVFIFKKEEWFDYFLERYPSSMISPKFLNLIVSTFNSRKINIFLKRFGDIILSLILLVVSLPLILIASCIVFLDDGFPIFYRQIRVGYKNEKFFIYKIRTMKVNSEKNGPQWATREDSRLTRFGRILRLSRIDELPQIFQVLTGKMSLIGPRPERPEIEETLIKVIPNYDLRKFVKPGLSGWAQVNFPYGCSIEDSASKLSYDLYYMKNFSILLDLLIMLKTIRLVINLDGAKPLKDKESLNKIN